MIRKVTLALLLYSSLLLGESLGVSDDSDIIPAPPSEHPACTHKNLGEFFDHLVGQWRGGGIFQLFVPPEFGDPILDPDNDLDTPLNFIEDPD